MNTGHGPRIACTCFVLLLLTALGCEYEYEIEVTHYDPARAYNGETLFASMHFPKVFLSVGMEGNQIWAFEDPDCYNFWDFEVTVSQDILYNCANHLVVRFRPPDTILWKRWFPAAHHSLVELPWGNILFLTDTYVQAAPWQEPLISDVIREIDPGTWEIVWEWALADHISPEEHYCPICMEEITVDDSRDWSHSNSLHYHEQDSTILLNARNLDTFLLLSYPSGEVLWACGDAGTFGAGLFHHPHDPERLPNGNILMFDNDEHTGGGARSRALELAIDPVAKTAEVVWEWRDEELWAPIMGDANRLPNGNTLVTDPWGGRLIEVNPSGDKVWEMVMKHPLAYRYHNFYKAERIPYPP